MKTDPQSYDALTERLQVLSGWLDNAHASLRRVEVGSKEGHDIAVAIGAVEREHSRIRQLVRNHPDAPAAG